MKSKHVNSVVGPVESFIQTIRGQRVILDADLAKIYGVPTRQLNQAVKRNLDRFPDICPSTTIVSLASENR